MVPPESVMTFVRRIGERIFEASSRMEALGTGYGPSPMLPDKYHRKLEAYYSLEPQYPVKRNGTHLALVTCKSSGPGSDPSGPTQHCVNLELFGETGTPRWVSLCSCGRPWVQRRPCVHVVMACLQRKVGPLRQGVRLAMRRLLT